MDVSDPENEEVMEASSNALPPLYRHSKRHQWGLGVMLLRLTDRAYMQFQDGQTRTMHLDYEDLLEPVDRPYDLARGLIEALEDMAPEELRPGKVRRVAPVRLAEQVAYFRELYPAGFGGDAYTEEHRGDGRKRPLKRHRDGVVALAEKSLSKAALDAAYEKGGATAVFASLVKLANASNLAAAKDRRAFAAIDAAHHEDVVASLRALLFGRAAVERRFDAWVRTLEVAMAAAPSWALATLFLGVHKPREHVVVKPSAVARQAQFMAPGLRIGSRPMGVLYVRLKKMVGDVRDRVESKGLAPRDMLDVYDFMWLTLKPAGRKRIEEIRYEAGLAELSEAAVGTA